MHHLLALQGQDYPGALWAVALRSGPRDRAAIERELEDGDLVRSWPMRGTLHVLRADDLGWLLELTRDRVVASHAARHRALELEPADLARAAAIADERLAGTRLERRALLAAFEEEGLSTAGQRGAHLLMWLAQHARIVLCSGTRYARFADRIPDPRTLTRPEALAELAERYVRGHGPATDRDLAWWAGITLTDARAGLAAVRDRFEAIEVDGTTHLHEPGLVPARPAAHVLPGFDEYVLGYTDRHVPLGDSPLERVVPGGNGMFLATVVLDGAIVATWRRGRRAGGTTAIDLERWRSIPASRAGAVRAAFRRWGEHVGETVLVEP